MSEDVLAIRDDEMPLPFGVRAATGEPLSGLRTEALKAIGVDPKAVTDRSQPEKHLAADESVKDPNDLKQAGWGIVLPGDVPSEVMTALKPLLELRQQQAGSLYKELGGYVPGRSPRDWLNSKGVTWGVVDPKKGVPLYLLLLGGPKQIPFEFQYMLDSYWNVGRLDFDSPADYRAYAEAVVAYETGASVPTTRSSALWVTGTPPIAQPVCFTIRSACRSRAGKTITPRSARRSDSSSRPISASRPRVPTSSRFCAARSPQGGRRCCSLAPTAWCSMRSIPRHNVRGKARSCRKPGRRVLHRHQISTCEPQTSPPTPASTG